MTFRFDLQFFAHKKGQGSSTNGRDSQPKYRGIKVFAGQTVNAGSILVRQCGTKVHPGKHVGLCRIGSRLHALRSRPRQGELSHEPLEKVRLDYPRRELRIRNEDLGIRDCTRPNSYFF